MKRLIAFIWAALASACVAGPSGLDVQTYTPVPGTAGSGGAVSGWAPNFNNSASGTAMNTNVFTLTRQWKNGAPPGGDQLTVAQIDGGATADSYSWKWFAGGGPQGTTAPTIDTPANLSTTIGVTIPAPPDAFGTVMGLEWPSGLTVGNKPFQVSPGNAITSGVGAKSRASKFYLCFYFYIPSGTTYNGNNIKWVILMQDNAGGGHSGKNDILMVAQGGNNTPFYARQGELSSANIGIASPAFSTNTWHMVEMYSQLEQPWGTASGVFKVWVDNVLVSNVTNLQTMLAYPVSSITNANPAVITTTVANNFTVGDYISCQGNSPAGFNTAGDTPGYPVTAVNGNSVTITWDTSAQGSTGTGGVCTRDIAAYRSGSVQPFYGGGGGNAPANEWVVVGKWQESWADN